jgi:hypothetical protein
MANSPFVLGVAVKQGGLLPVTDKTSSVEGLA